MKFLQGVITLCLLLASARNRKEMRRAADTLSDATDDVNASLRRLEALENGGKPKVRLIAN